MKNARERSQRAKLEIVKLRNSCSYSITKKPKRIGEGSNPSGFTNLTEKKQGLQGRQLSKGKDQH